MHPKAIIRRCLDALVPRRYWMAYDFAMYRLMGRLEEELLLLDRLPAGRETAVDVGANRGLYAYRMSRLFRKVYAFEPNPAVTRKLERSRLPNVQLLNVALSDTHSVMQLHIPIVRGTEYGGWASFDRENLPGCTEFRTLDVEARPLDAFRLGEVSLIKIDVEGHEVEVLRGARDTIGRCRPVILVEVKERNRSRIADLLAGLGYACREWVAGELCEVEGGLESYGGPKENFIFVPSPRRKA